MWLVGAVFGCGVVFFRCFVDARYCFVDIYVVPAIASRLFLAHASVHGCFRFWWRLALLDGCFRLIRGCFRKLLVGGYVFFVCVGCGCMMLFSVFACCCVVAACDYFVVI